MTKSNELNDISDIFPDIIPNKVISLTGEDRKEPGTGLNPVRVTISSPAKISKELREEIDRLVDLCTFKDAVLTGAKPIGRALAGEMFELIPIINQQQEMARLSESPSVSNYNRVERIALREIKELEDKLPFWQTDETSFIAQAKRFASELRGSDIHSRTEAMCDFILSKITVTEGAYHHSVPKHVRAVFRIDGSESIEDILQVPLEKLTRGEVVDGSGNLDNLIHQIDFKSDSFNHLANHLFNNDSSRQVERRTIGSIILSLTNGILNRNFNSGIGPTLTRALERMEHIDKDIADKNHRAILEKVESLYNVAEQAIRFNDYCSRENNLFEVLIRFINITKA